MKRRDFLRKAAVGAAALSAVGGPVAGIAKADPALPKRKLGKTNVEVSVHGCGTLHMPEDGYEEIIERVMELGVTYLDTAACYQNGNVERRLATILPRVRDKLFLATKWHQGGPVETFTTWLDDALQRMKVDDVDLVQVHNLSKAEEVTDERIFEAFAQAKQAGKARFLGFTTHKNVDEVCTAGIGTGQYDTMLIRYGPLADARDNLTAVVKKGYDAGLGVIGIKSQEGGKDFPGMENLTGDGVNIWQARVKWALSNPELSILLTDCETLEHAEENTVAAMQEMTEADRRVIERYLALAGPHTCTWCGQCERACPQGVRVADIMRYEAYVTGYRQPATGREGYARLPKEQTFAACDSCGACEGACPNGLRVVQRLKEAHRVLA